MTKFKQHSDVTRPEWLEGPQWDDASWGNDAMPHCVLYLTDGDPEETPAVEVWVNYEDPNDREVPPRYMVVFMRDWAGESSSDVTLYQGDDEWTAHACARGAEIARTIIADILANPMVDSHRLGGPANMLDAESFSELHDYCDANMLGETEKLLDEYPCDDGVSDECTDVLNAAQEIVDRWLKLPNRPRPAAEPEEDEDE